MLILTRKIGQAVTVDGPARIVYTSNKTANVIRLGIDAAADVTIDRPEMVGTPPQCWTRYRRLGELQGRLWEVLGNAGSIGELQTQIDSECITFQHRRLDGGEIKVLSASFTDYEIESNTPEELAVSVIVKWFGKYAAAVIGNNTAKAGAI
jgi:hypothetical protein